MEYIMKLHRDKVQQSRLPFAKVESAQEQADLALVFSVTGYETTNFSQCQHIAIARSLKCFGYEYSPAFKARGENALLANKGMTVDALRF
jgi:hypothetical protein